MTADSDDLPAGWLTQFRRAAGTGIALLLLAIGLCAIPAFAVWLVPGLDTAPATSALKAAALMVLAAAHGPIMLDGSQSTLAPLAVTGLLGWLLSVQARRLGSWSAVAGLTSGYALASAVAARLCRLGSTEAPVLRSLLAAAVFAGLVAGATRVAGQLKDVLAPRWRRVVRAALALSCYYLVAGSVLAAAMLIGSFGDAVATQRQVAPGAAGLPVALLGVSAAPNAVLSAVSYLTGPGFAVGTHTSVSVFGVERGRLPLFPLLAALPHGGPASLLGLLAIGLLALGAGWLVLRMVATTGSWWTRLLDCAAVATVTGVILAVLTGLAGGSLGAGALARVGALWWLVGASTILVLLFGSALWLTVEVLRGKPAVVGTPALYAVRSADRPAAAAAGEPATPAVDERTGPAVARAAAAAAEARSRSAS